MERVQGPLPKGAAFVHPLSCLLPNPELCPQYPALTHYNSQALFCSNSSNAPPDLAQPWPPHPLHGPNVGTDFPNMLQCKQCVSDNGLSPVSPLLEPIVNNSTGPALLFDEWVGMDKSKTFSQAVLPVPFSCKLDLAAADSRTTLLASLSAHIAEGVGNTSVEDNGSSSTKDVGKRKLSCDGHMKSISEHAAEVLTEVGLKGFGQKQNDDVGGATSCSSSENGIGLKLGKRTYFVESAADSVVDAGNNEQSDTTNANNCNVNGRNSTGGGSSKKPKASTPVANVPRCQAEDCKMDLSGAKDYHRRHKVCEWHSKCSKVKVSNMDQRFCQQCSRFHVLSEFDEGKRSCRRRLAGHNERRRKQQPDPFSVLSAASHAYIAGGRYLFGAPPPLDDTHLLNHDLLGAAFGKVKMLHEPREELAGNHSALELHQFLQGPNGVEEHLTLGSSAQALLMANGNSSCPLASVTTLAACLIPDHPPETLVSGRALSLLSSSLGFPNTSYSLSTSSGRSLEGILMENQHGLTTSSQEIVSRASCLDLNALKRSEMLHLMHSDDMKRLLDSENPADSQCINMDQVQSSTMLSFNCSSNFRILPGGDANKDANPRPALDLMQAYL